MTQHQLPASLYAPLRVVLYENEAGHAVFEYDRPSSLFGQFGDERVTEVACELDASLERVLVKAATCKLVKQSPTDHPFLTPAQAGAHRAAGTDR